MGREFEIVREFEVAATPEQVWNAITENSGGWLWPSEYKPGEDDFITTWEPPRRLVIDQEIEGGPQSRNHLDHLIEPREGGAWVRYVHSGVFVENWDDQYDGANKHTDFYLHTMRQYLEHFAGRAAAFLHVQGPEASMEKDAFETVVRALGLGTAEAGEKVRAQTPEGVLDAVLDYRNEYFVGLRTDEAMYRFFGRNHFGGPVGVAVHRFAPGGGGEGAWQEWLNGLYA